MEKWDCCVQGQGHSNGSEFHGLSLWYLLNPWTFCKQTVVVHHCKQMPSFWQHLDELIFRMTFAAKLTLPAPSSTVKWLSHWTIHKTGMPSRVTQPWIIAGITSWSLQIYDSFCVVNKPGVQIWQVVTQLALWPVIMIKCNCWSNIVSLLITCEHCHWN